MQSSIYAQLGKLRLLVGALGEKDRCNWWPTTFFAPTSKSFLMPLYPRTFPLAQYHGVSEAARRVHDGHLNVGSFHLFRLPEEVEHDIHALVISWSSNVIEAMIGQDRASALSALAELGGVEEGRVEGPISCGEVQGLLSGSAHPKVASIYRQAFEADVQAFPYFTSGS